MARGFGLEFMKSMLSFMSSSCIKEWQFYRESCFKTFATTTRMILTVIIGSSGPKISSVMISASSGGFNNIVGSINLSKLQIA